MIPGEYIIRSEPVEINQGRETKTVLVRNRGDRPIQVGSHFHFFEANRYLEFDRAQTFGYRLDIASGTAIRFEPNEEKEACLVAFGGNKRVIGFNNLTDALADGDAVQGCLEKAKRRKFI